MTRPHRLRSGARGRWCALLSALLVALVGQVAFARAAQAADYQYWGYWQLANGAWSFAQKGPTETKPADGAVEGWRWVVADESGRPPRLLPTFDAVCGATAVDSGKKRVAVVVDFGRPADGDGTTNPPEPTAECAVVVAAATGAEVLAAVGTVRGGDGGLVCGIDTYPASGCGGQVAALSDAQKAADTSVTLGPTATPQTSTTSGTAQGILPTAVATAGPVAGGQTSTGQSSGVPVVVWVGLVILLVGAALLAWAAYRRRRTSV